MSNTQTDDGERWLFHIAMRRVPNIFSSIFWVFNFVKFTRICIPDPCARIAPTSKSKCYLFYSILRWHSSWTRHQFTIYYFEFGLSLLIQLKSKHANPRNKSCNFMCFDSSNRLTFYFLSQIYSCQYPALTWKAHTIGAGLYHMAHRRRTKLSSAPSSDTVKHPKCKLLFGFSFQVSHVGLAVLRAKVFSITIYGQNYHFIAIN